MSARPAGADDDAQIKAELEVQEALDETGFGKFNYKLLCASGLVCTYSAFSLTSLGFILPAAACDFDMDTIDKGRIGTTPIFGMLLGSCIWGCIADAKGRRLTLLICLVLQCFFDCSASIVSNYWGFLAFKFGSGIAQSGQVIVIYTYLGEFQPSAQRGKMLSYMEIPWVLGISLSPVLAWSIIPLEIDLTTEYISFKSWNLYVAICGLSSILVACVVLRLPETPKYLASIGRHSELRKVLTAMYRENTGNESGEYIAKLNKAGITYFADSATGYANETSGKINHESVNRSNVFDTFRDFFCTVGRQMRTLMKPPYLGRMTIILVGTYGIYASIFTLYLWFPELFQRFAAFEKKYPGESASVCVVSSYRPPEDLDEQTGNMSSTIGLDVSNILFPETVSVCVSTIETRVYIHMLVISFACIPLAIILPFGVSRLGFQFFLVSNTFICGAAIVGMIFATSSTQNLVLSCIFESVVSVCATIIFCLAVELFPTHLRVTASAACSISGRVGALVGNSTIGYMIDNYCLLLMYLVAAHLFAAGVLALFLPADSRATSKQRSHKKADVPDIGDTRHTDKYYSSNQA